MIASTITKDQVRLASDVADEFFPNIHCDNYSEDVSWLATMRALLPSRLPAGEEAYLRLQQVNQLPPSKGKNLASDLLDLADISARNTVTVVSISADHEAMAQAADAIRKTGVPGHEFHERIYSRFHDGETPSYILAFIQDDIANTVIFTDSMNTRKWHIVQVFMRSYFKNFFLEHPFTEDEEAMIRCLSSAKAVPLDTYREIMSRFEAGHDFRGATIRRELAKFTGRVREQRLKTVEKSVANLTRDLQTYQDRIRAATAQRDRKMIELYGLRYAAGQDESADQELLTYFLTNKALVFDGQTSGGFSYWVKSEMTYWDDQEAESYIKTLGGYLYAGCENYDIPKRKFQQLLKEILLERKVRIRMAASFDLCYTDEQIGITINDGKSVIPELKDYLMNPHLMGYSCWGSHADNLNEALIAGDYAGAVAVTVAATSQITIHDSAIGKFSNWLCSSGQKCLLLPDGSTMTCREYLETL